MDDTSKNTLNRRDMLKAGAAVASAAVLPLGQAAAQAAQPYVRYNITDPRGQAMLDDYRRAVKEMLRLPPDDIRNWYRVAFTHFLDCPHGNWWFLPWHRGFLGYVEQIVRKYSGNDRFAFPYWDWTANPEVPAGVYGNTLDPSDPAFIGSSDLFQRRFTAALGRTSYWRRSPGPGDAQGTTPFGQLLVRGVRFQPDLWFDLVSDPRGLVFFPRAKARGIKANARHLDAYTSDAVSAPTIQTALGPRDFMTFSSPAAPSHSIVFGFGILERKPHNRVHNNVGGIVKAADGTQIADHGGFMQANLSPVDPIFFLHHANIDRLWDVWTRKQQRLGLPTLPGEDLYKDWAAEQFLFYPNVSGQPVSGALTAAGNYANIGQFNYVYQPGSGEELVPPATAAAAALAGRRQRPAERHHFAAASSAEERRLGVPITLPRSLLLAEGPEAPILYAEITVSIPPHAHGESFNVFAHSGDPADSQMIDSLSLFGHRGAHGPLRFVVPLSPGIASLGSRKTLRANQPIYLRVVRAGGGHHGPALLGGPGDRELTVHSVEVSAH